MNITDTCCKEIYTKICDCFTFVRICTFTCTNNTIFFSTDRTNFCFDRASFCMSCRY